MIIELTQNRPLLGLVLAVLALFFFSQIVVAKVEYFLRWKRYRDARSFAATKGKPLLVIGRPGSPLRVYGCGDVCIDLDRRVTTDCPECGLVTDVRHIPFGDKHFGAVFCSHILEYLPGVAEAQQAVAEMRRVADGVFLCYTLECNILWRWFSVAQRLWVFHRRGTVSFKKRPW